MYIILQIGCDCFTARPVAERMRKHAAAFTCHAGRRRGSPAPAAGGARRRHAEGTQREIEKLSAMMQSRGRQVFSSSIGESRDATRPNSRARSDRQHMLQGQVTVRVRCGMEAEY